VGEAVEIARRTDSIDATGDALIDAAEVYDSSAARASRRRRSAKRSLSTNARTT
jgi:hypothetical protein